MYILLMTKLIFGQLRNQEPFLIFGYDFTEIEILRRIQILFIG